MLSGHRLTVRAEGTNNSLGAMASALRQAVKANHTSAAATKQQLGGAAAASPHSLSVHSHRLS